MSDYDRSYVQAAPAPEAAPRRKRPIFWWVFLAIQAIFVAWIITGITTAGGTDTATLHHVCDNGGWQGLFASHADCMQHYAVALRDAGNTGTALGVGLVVLLWVLVDFFTGLGYLIYRLARRPGIRGD